jgi:antitoxin component of RelBE/YafQ-DinJ toxin-antitoxin module
MPSAPTGKQVSCRVSDTVKEAFDQYAKDCGLDDSPLARLLILRERRHRQLAAFVDSGADIDSELSSARESSKITIYFSTETFVSEFDRYAQSCGLGRGKAAAWIIERELRERWFESALSMPPTSTP